MKRIFYIIVLLFFIGGCTNATSFDRRSCAEDITKFLKSFDLKENFTIGRIWSTGCNFTFVNKDNQLNLGICDRGYRTTNYPYCQIVVEN